MPDSQRHLLTEKNFSKITEGENQLKFDHYNRKKPLPRAGSRDQREHSNADFSI